MEIPIFRCKYHGHAYAENHPCPMCLDTARKIDKDEEYARLGISRDEIREDPWIKYRPKYYIK